MREWESIGRRSICCSHEQISDTSTVLDEQVMSRSKVEVMDTSSVHRPKRRRGPLEQRAQHPRTSRRAGKKRKLAHAARQGPTSIFRAPHDSIGSLVDVLVDIGWELLLAEP
jgi:hypothetical protein